VFDAMMAAMERAGAVRLSASEVGALTKVAITSVGEGDQKHDVPSRDFLGQDAAVLAADILVSPITPEILSAREFKDGTMELLDRLEPGSALGATLGHMKAVIYRQDRTTDARVIASGIRDDFIKLKGRVSVLETVVPHAKAYKEAATLRIPVHRHERKREGVTTSACTVMHQLAWELIPSLQGVYADSIRMQERIA